MQTKRSFATKFTYWLKVVSLGMVLGLGLQFAQAWVAPIAAPPGGNVAGPLTTGVSSQVKTGGLTLGALLLSGKPNCDLKTSATGLVTCGVDATASGGDNLGSHLATQNLNMGTKQIYGLVGGNSLSWGSTAGTGNSIYSDGANGNIGIRASGAVHIQNQAGTGNTTLYTGYTYSSSTIDAHDYWIRAAGKWASEMSASPSGTLCGMVRQCNNRTHPDSHVADCMGMNPCDSCPSGYRFERYVVDSYDGAFCVKS